MHVIITKCQ